MTGRLGSWAVYANLPQAVYACDKSQATVVVVNICNRNNVPALIRIAVSSSSTSPANADYIEYDVELGPKGVLERTGVTVNPGQYIIVQSSIDAVSVVCWGPTMGDEYPVTAIPTAPRWNTDTDVTVYAGYTANAQLKAVDPKGALPITYSLGSGSLPPNTTLTSDGFITGTVSTAGYNTNGVTTTATVQATDGVTVVPKTFNIIRRWQDGLSLANAAPSAQYIKTLTGTTTNGDYWIKPTGQSAYQIYCDMTSQSGGWMLVGVGRNGRADNFITRDWWRDEGDTSKAYETGLKQANLSGAANYNPRYMPVSWIQAAAGGYTWSEVEMIVNRIELADSMYYRNSTSMFSWSSFEANPTSVSLNYSYWTGVWLTGSNTYNYTNTFWTDTLNNGSPVVNDQNRWFTWTWDGHAGNTGWSSGSGVTGNGTIPGPDAGFVNSNEGHALQMVNIFVR